MSTNSLITNFDRTKVFLGENTYQSDNYVNGTSYDPITLVKGTVMGRISASGNLTPVIQGANNGADKPIGILAEDYEIDAGVTKQVTICDKGEVAESEIVFWDGVLTLNTVLSGQRYRDHLTYLGIKLRGGTEMTSLDNQ